MSKTLVAYFSASGVTAKLAKTLASAIGADLHEIRPEVPYTAEDLDWMNSKSRSAVEMSDKSFRPKVANKVENMADYDTVFVGFPIWWYVAPTIINTFLEQHDLAGKKIIPFATSGGSGISTATDNLKALSPDATWLEGHRFETGADEETIQAWINELGILK